jgi:putrescine aminotransferase
MTISSTTAAHATSAAQLEALDRRYLVHPHQTGQRSDRLVIVRAEGCVLWDADGHELLDVTGGGNWVAQIGHGRRELADIAARQILDLDYFSCFHEFSNNKAIELAVRLAGLAPDGMSRIFFSSGGSEGVDTAIKAARVYHYRRGEPDRTWILARRFSYHGATFGAVSATGFETFHQEIGPILAEIERVTPPMPYHAELYGGEDPSDFLLRELEGAILRVGPQRIAAMIGEPVMGGAGIVSPPAGYWPRVRELLRRYGILLIADEVITAYGRTGAWFASVRGGMDPDIIVTAKGITSGYAPLGAVLMRDGIGETLAGGDVLFHGHTYYGHPVACALALANLDIIENEKLVDRALLIGDWFRDGLAPATLFPAVGDIRVEGAMIGIELVSDRDTREMMQPDGLRAVVDELHFAHGVIVRNYGPVLVMGPPLVFTEQQARRVTRALVEVLSRLRPDGTLAPRG